MKEPMLILIAGPYRSGTDDEPERLATNLEYLESMAWPIFEAGHYFNPHAQRIMSPASRCSCTDQLNERGARSHRRSRKKTLVNRVCRTRVA